MAGPRQGEITVDFSPKTFPVVFARNGFPYIFSPKAKSLRIPQQSRSTKDFDKGIASGNIGNWDNLPLLGHSGECSFTFVINYN